MSGLGFLFWLIVARLYPAHEVGLAGTLIATMGTLSVLGLAGFDTSIIRFLAQDKDRNATLSTSFYITGLTAGVLATLFVLGIDHISPDLAFIKASLATGLAFIFFTIFGTLNTLTDAIFLSYRQTKFSLFIDTTFSVLKIALPFAFIPWGAFGIFAAAAVAQMVGFVLSISSLLYWFSFRPQWSMSRATLRRVWRYSIGNYVADVFNFLPNTILPIIIVNYLGSDVSAYYYIIMMIAGFLYVIPTSIARSLFAEGSFDEKDLALHMRTTVRLAALLMAPAMLILFLGGWYALSIFGPNYAEAGTIPLRILTVASVFVALSSLYATLFRLRGAIQGLIVRNAVFTVSSISLTYLLLPHGLTGVASAYALGHLCAALVSFGMYEYHKRFTLWKRRPTTRVPTHAGFARHLTKSVRMWLCEQIFFPIITVLTYKFLYLKARVASKQPPRTILFYPQLPKTYHVLYKACHTLGYKITNNPQATADLIINFNDVTKHTPDPVLRRLSEQQQVVNIEATDISKTRVEEVFHNIFGYGMAVDPRTYTGTCVRKSDTNAVHDGTLVTCPREPEDGYIYQHLIETDTPDGFVYDLRIYIFKDSIPFVLKRYKQPHDRFDITVKAECFETHDVLSPDEVEKVLRFSKAMGLDYGEIDALRCRKSDAFYIVDVNSTPAGPLSVIGDDHEEFRKWFTLLCISFNKTFFRPPYTAT